jgi:hypothetical protein
MLETTRRNFAKGLAAVSGAPLRAVGPAPASAAECLPIHELNLPADVLADLESFSEPVLAQALYLKELPLQGVEPGFVFIPK